MTSPDRPGQARRQEAIDALCDAFARDEMELEEFERRVETAHRAATAAELDRLLADLSPILVPVRRVSAGQPGSARRSAARRPTALSGHVREREVIAGVMGGSMRRGRWSPARRITAIGIMGGVELDFREAILVPGVTEIHAFAFWGGLEILVPQEDRRRVRGQSRRAGGRENET